MHYIYINLMEQQDQVYFLYASVYNQQIKPFTQDFNNNGQHSRLVPSQLGLGTNQFSDKNGGLNST